MTRVKLVAAAALLALAPATVFTQSGLSDPAVPGSGYRISATPRTSQQPLAAYQTDPGGNGFIAVPFDYQYDYICECDRLAITEP